MASESGAAVTAPNQEEGANVASPTTSKNSLAIVDFVDTLPREVWHSRNGWYRLLITRNGPMDCLNTILPTDEPAYASVRGDVYWAVEVRDGYDMLGGELWRPLERYKDQLHWREVFRELAKATGLFQP